MAVFRFASVNVPAVPAVGSVDGAPDDTATVVAAVPFFGNTLAGYAVFGGILFGGFSLLQRRYEALAPVVARP